MLYEVITGVNLETALAFIAGVVSSALAGYRGIRLLRRKQDDEVEFITIMEFDSRNNFV